MLHIPTSQNLGRGKPPTTQTVTHHSIAYMASLVERVTVENE
ncbi:hypothetical protein [Moraxella osloensis]|nr:hypothetical protein [Moraxella osloensis]